MNLQLTMLHTGSSLVVQWVNARLRTGQTTAPFNFQCELAASGAITFYYLTVCGWFRQSAVGDCFVEVLTNVNG